MCFAIYTVTHHQNLILASNVILMLWKRNNFIEYTVQWTKIPDLIYHRHVCDSNSPSLCINNLSKEKIVQEMPCQKKDRKTEP